MRGRGGLELVLVGIRGKFKGGDSPLQNNVEGCTPARERILCPLKAKSRTGSDEGAIGGHMDRDSGNGERDVGMASYGLGHT